MGFPISHLPPPVTAEQNEEFKKIISNIRISEVATIEATIKALENKIYELEDKERQLVDMIDAREDYIDTLEEKLKGGAK